MSTWQDPDLYRAASHQNAFSHLTGPFSAAAAESKLSVDNTGRIHVEWSPREPVMLVAPKTSLTTSGLQVSAILDPDGAKTALPLVQFAPYTEMGAFLVAHLPKIDPNTRTADPFVIAFTVSQVQADNTLTPVAPASIKDTIQVVVVEGVFGRMSYVMLQEKQRLRRMAREIAASRVLSLAHDDSLDRLGAEVGVVRFGENLVYDNPSHQITTVSRREPDSEYRRRIQLYRKWMFPNHGGLLWLLNGRGADGDPNAGLLSGLGLKDRFQIVEEDNAFAVAIHVVEQGNAGLRDKFLNYLRSVHMVWPAASAPANAAHDARYLPQEMKDRINQQRSRLRKAFQFADDMAVAPMLAGVLDRVGRCRIELGDDSQWKVARAQDSKGGSRYELGLGVDVPPLTPAILDRMVDKLKEKNRNRKAAKDAEVEALLRSMTPVASADDPEGRWLLEPCGFRTIHRTSTKNLYLSHLPTSGLMITESAATPKGLPLQALYQAPGDPGSHLALVQGMAAALKQWKDSGGQDWIPLADGAARAQWDTAVDRAAADHALEVFASAGLPAVQKPQPIVAQLKNIPSELIVTVRLPAALEQQVLNGDAVQAANSLTKLVTALRSSGLNSVLPIVSGPLAGPNQVLLVIGVIGLPSAGLNLSESRSTGFRWYVVPLIGNGGAIGTVGSKTVYAPSGNGVSAIVTIGYSRQPDKTDPYEYRIEMKPGATLNLLQYEFLMNLLDQTCPAGVEVNTYSIRQQHVDLDGDKVPNPLPPGLFRTYRQFQRRRQRGQVGVPFAGN